MAHREKISPSNDPDSLQDYNEQSTIADKDTYLQKCRKENADKVTKEWLTLYDEYERLAMFKTEIRNGLHCMEDSVKRIMAIGTFMEVDAKMMSIRQRLLKMLNCREESAESPSGSKTKSNLLFVRQGIVQIRPVK